MADRETGNDRTPDEQRRNEVVARLDEKQRERFDLQVYLLEQRDGTEPSIRLQDQLATIIAKDLPATYESHDIKQTIRDEDAKRGSLGERPPIAPAKQSDADQPDPKQTASTQKTPAPQKLDDPMEAVRPSGTRDYSKLQQTHDQVASAMKQPDARTELGSRIDLLQREAERTSEDPEVLRGSRQLFDIDQRRLDRRISAADPATAAGFRTEKEASAQEYVGYLTDTIGNQLERDGRDDQAANMHREAEARREIAGQLRDAKDSSTLDASHDAANHGELSAERVLARSNEESIRRQQAEVAVSTGGEVSRDDAMTREQMRDDLKAMARASEQHGSANERDDGASQPDHDNGAAPSPGRGGPGP